MIVNTIHGVGMWYTVITFYFLHNVQFSLKLIISLLFIHLIVNVPTMNSTPKFLPVVWISFQKVRAY